MTKYEFHWKILPAFRIQRPRRFERDGFSVDVSAETIVLKTGFTETPEGRRASRKNSEDRAKRSSCFRFTAKTEDIWSSTTLNINAKVRAMDNSQLKCTIGCPLWLTKWPRVSAT